MRSLPVRQLHQVPVFVGRAQADETILFHGILGQAGERFVDLDLPGLIGPGGQVERLSRPC